MIGEYVSLRDRLHAIVDLAAWMPATHPVDVDGEAARRKGVAITTNLLTLLGVSPVVGHGFATSDGNYGAGNVLLISHAFWQREFAGASDIIGRIVLSRDRRSRSSVSCYHRSIFRATMSNPGNR